MVPELVAQSRPNSAQHHATGSVPMGHSKEASSSNSLHPFRRPSHTSHLAITPTCSLRALSDFGEHWVWRYRSQTGAAEFCRSLLKT
jgi:hypothetical protein